MSLTDDLNVLTNAQSIAELWDFHHRKMASYGFTRIFYGYTRYRSGNSLGDPDDFVTLTNHQPEYTDVFFAENHYFHAPMVRWALANDGACSWAILAEMFASNTLTKSEQRVLDFNRSMGVTSGYSISFRSISPRSKGAIALSPDAGVSQSEVDEIWARYGDDILVLNNVAHLKILSLPYSSPARGLTSRQREALEWVGDGKTTQDIAMLMELRPATVEKHLRLAREALSVETTAQAVLKAALQNQMFVVEL